MANWHLKGKRALITGATKGIGRAIAEEFLSLGAEILIVARNEKEVNDAVAEWQKQGHKAFGCIADVAKGEDRQKVMATVKDVFGDRLDILVNNAWGGYEQMEHDGEFTWPHVFWSQPLWRWDAKFQSGVRAAYVASAFAARMMVEQKNGLIVNISFWAAQKYMGNASYGAAKAAVDKMSADMAHEAEKFNVAVISLYPGLVRTESILRNAQYFDMTNSESPQFIGRVIAALATDVNIMKKSGQVLVAAQEALEYGIKDVDGKQPRPLKLEDF